MWSSVATVRAIKFHGGVEVPDLGKENLKALQAGIANLDRHIDNVRDVFGLPCLVAINHTVIRLVEQCERKRAHDQQWHEILEHRTAPTQ